MLKTYKELLVWQKSIRLVKEVYAKTAMFPADERFGLCAQMRRSAVSIPSNIAEGYGRQTRPDYLRFLYIAIGSLYELETQLTIALELGFLANDVYGELGAQVRELERMLSSMKAKLSVKRGDSP